MNPFQAQEARRILQNAIRPKPRAERRGRAARRGARRALHALRKAVWFFQKTMTTPRPQTILGPKPRAELWRTRGAARARLQETVSLELLRRLQARTARHASRRRAALRGRFACKAPRAIECHAAPSGPSRAPRGEDAPRGEGAPRGAARAFLPKPFKALQCFNPQGAARLKPRAERRGRAAPRALRTRRGIRSVPFKTL